MSGCRCQWPWNRSIICSNCCFSSARFDRPERPYSAPSHTPNRYSSPSQKANGSPSMSKKRSCSDGAAGPTSRGRPPVSRWRRAPAGSSSWAGTCPCRSRPGGAPDRARARSASSTVAVASAPRVLMPSVAIAPCAGCARCRPRWAARRRRATPAGTGRRTTCRRRSARPDRGRSPCGWPGRELASPARPRSGPWRGGSRPSSRPFGTCAARSAHRP